MKNLLTILALLISFVSIGQLQPINVPGDTPREIYVKARDNFNYLDSVTANSGTYKVPDYVAALGVKMDLLGQGTLTLTNGSNVVSGHGTNFLNSELGIGVSYWFGFWAIAEDGTPYRLYLSAIQNDSSATISSAYTEAQIASGFGSFSTTFPGPTGTYSYKVVTNFTRGHFSMAFGNHSYVGDYAAAFGGSNIATGQTAFATGLYTYASGAQSFTMGANTKAPGGKSFAGGWGSFSASSGSPVDKRITAGGSASFNFSISNTSQVVGHGANAESSAILGGRNQDIPSTSLRSAIVGGDGIKVAASVLNTFHTGKIRFGLGTSAATVVDNTNYNLLARDAATGEVEIHTALSGSASLDFGSTAPGDVSDLTLTVTGAVVGDPVMLGIPLPNGNTSYFAWVSAANVVTIRLIVASGAGAAQNPSPGTFKVVVIK